MEWLAIEQATKTGRYQLDNGNAGGEPAVPEWMRAEVAEVFETMEVLLGTLGFPIFEPAADHVAVGQSVFVCRRGGADARGVYNEEGFVVLKGSIARRDMTTSAQDTVGPRREEMISSGALAPTKSGYRFVKDVPFSTPTHAIVGNVLRITAQRSIITLSRNVAGVVIGVGATPTTDQTSDVNLESCP